MSDKKVIVSAGNIIDEEHIERIEDEGIDSVLVRSVLTL